MAGNTVIIGTDPLFHARRFNLPGAYAVVQDAIRHVATGKDDTGMYFSRSCYYQSNQSSGYRRSFGDRRLPGPKKPQPPMSKKRSFGRHVQRHDTAQRQKLPSNRNCSDDKVFSGYPGTGSGSFEALVIAINATKLGEQSFANSTGGAPYIIARGAIPLGCGNNVTEPDYKE